VVGVGKVQRVGGDRLVPVVRSEREGQTRIFQPDTGSAEAAEDVGEGDAGALAGGSPVAVGGGQGGLDFGDVFGG
jgi:hypothetical protein